jgi:hypothetical protein
MNLSPPGCKRDAMDDDLLIASLAAGDDRPPLSPE